MKLIDADALMDALGISEDCEDCQYSNRGFFGCKKDPDFVYACEVITNAPTIDPVKHGRWAHLALSDIATNPNTPIFYYDHVQCSCCGKVFPKVLEKMNYCGNCGARMRGEEDD